jgi:DnaJ-class molecular chaperone
MGPEEWEPEDWMDEYGYDEPEECPECSGHGRDRMTGVECDQCNGTGTL